ncbi:MAG: hypothetical protein ACFFC7_23845 [Candidatus Hermodarchaeota archaeon]
MVHLSHCTLESVRKLSDKKDTEEHTGHNSSPPALLDAHSW